MTSFESTQASAPTRRWAIASMVASAACWGFATVMSKGALEILPPISQLGASIVFLWAVALAKGYRLTLDQGARLAALSGVLEPGLAYALGIGGLAHTTASNASLISTTEPLIVIALAFLLFKVRTGGRQLVAILIAMAGVGLVSFSETVGGDCSGFGGDAMIVAATFFAALYVVITSRLVISTAPLVLAVLQQSVGFVFALALLVGAFALEAKRIETWPSFEGWILGITSGIIQYALAFWFYLAALRVLPVSTAALFLALNAVFGVGGAVILLGELLSSAQLFGSTLIIAAVLAATAATNDKS